MDLSQLAFYFGLAPVSMTIAAFIVRKGEACSLQAASAASATSAASAASAASGEVGVLKGKNEAVREMELVGSAWFLFF